MNTLLSKMKEIIKRNQGVYIIVEDDEPEMVVLSFDQYEKLINKRTNVTIAGNIHKDIVKRANETMQRAMEKRSYAQDPTVDEIEAASQMMTPPTIEQPLSQGEEIPLEQGQNQQIQAQPQPQDQLFVDPALDQEFSPAAQEEQKA